MFYSKASSPEDLPWYSEEPPKLLLDAVAQKRKPGRALDLGCGTGDLSVYLAKLGYDVTGIDFISKALEFAEQCARRENVNVDLVHADILEWETPKPFDLVIDSGCLHNIPSGKMKRYKNQLLSWTKEKSDFILAHWGKRHRLDWRPIGPKRRSRKQLIRCFSPEFQEQGYEQEILTGIDLPIGPSALGQCFWFQRKEHSDK